MAFLHFDNVGVAALTCAVPSFVQKVNTEPQFVNATYARNFVKKIGMRERHVSLIEQTCTDLGYAAVSKALEKARWEPQSLDALIFLSQMPDFNPGTGNAFILHKHLNLPFRTLAFDITLGCSSFPFGLSTAAGLMQQQDINRVALISGDNVWPSIQGKDALLNENLFLFGEGTTAVLLETKENSPVDLALYTDGSGYEFLFNPRAGFRNNWRHGNTIKLTNGNIIQAPKSKGGQYMDGPEITTFSTTTVVNSIKEFLSHFKKELSSFDSLVLHQANKQIINSIAKRVGADIPVPMSLDRYGNTSGASVLVTIADAFGHMENGVLDLLICAYGIGLSWGIASLKIDASVIDPIFPTDLRFEEGYIIEE